MPPEGDQQRQSKAWVVDESVTSRDVASRARSSHQLLVRLFMGIIQRSSVRKTKCVTTLKIRRRNEEKRNAWRTVVERKKNSRFAWVPRIKLGANPVSSVYVYAGVKIKSSNRLKVERVSLLMNISISAPDLTTGGEDKRASYIKEASDLLKRAKEIWVYVWYMQDEYKEREYHLGGWCRLEESIDSIVVEIWVLITLVIVELFVGILVGTKRIFVFHGTALIPLPLSRKSILV